MKRSRAIVEKRREKLLTVLELNGVVKVGDLAEKFQVSALTIRRDLQFLEEQRKLERFYGGATAAGMERERSSDENEIRTFRKGIAYYAASLVEDGDTIFINNSKTALQMLNYLGNKHVTVITNSSQVVAMKFDSHISLILSGGELREAQEGMVGEFALSNLSKVTAKKSFLGCSGINKECGMTTDNIGEVNINELMMERITGEAYVLADSSKIGKNNSFVTCPIKKIKNLITDEKASQELMDHFRECGMNVTQVRKNMEVMDAELA